MYREFPEIWEISASSFLQSVNPLLQLPLAILEDASDICLAWVITSLPKPSWPFKDRPLDLREQILNPSAITLGCILPAVTHFGTGLCSLYFDLLPQAVLHFPWLCPQHRGVGGDLSVNTKAMKSPNALCISMWKINVPTHLNLHTHVVYIHHTQEPKDTHL